MMQAPFDARRIANVLLDEADRIDCRISNLVLQKLLYFAHGRFLIEHKAPLVMGYFEAWHYGPVHPQTYSVFKSAGSEPIRFRAQGVDALTGRPVDLKKLDDPMLRRHVQGVLHEYGRLSPGRLVDVAHAPNAPWAHVVHKSRTSVAFGMRISDDLIRERFKFHKVSVGNAPRSGEPLEDTPLT